MQCFNYVLMIKIETYLYNGSKT